MSVGTATPSQGFGTKKSKPGTIEGPNGYWKFIYDITQEPKESSQRKQIYRGNFVELPMGRPIDARALAFRPEQVEAFGNECANLHRLSALGVGPKALAITQHTFSVVEGSRPTIIEENVGKCLADLLGEMKLQKDGMPVLHAAGTKERSLENKKILYDVFVQVQNAHSGGIYHRDLRCENVCVRRFGKNPADIRATIIDFDLGTERSDGEAATATSLYQTLFRVIPSHLTKSDRLMTPNALALDMGYLAALQYHIERDRLILNETNLTSKAMDDFATFLRTHVGYFGYIQDSPMPYARELYATIEIDGLAKLLELAPTSEETFPSEQLLDYARSLHWPYLDSDHIDRIMSRPEAKPAEMIDKIAHAKFETYKALRRSQGQEVLYERLEDQPESLQKSNYAQARHIAVKVQTLGYMLASDYDSERYEEVCSFSREEVEMLARLEHDRWMDERISAGWTLLANSTASNPYTQTTPHLIPYDELSDRMKEYDRDAARQVIPLVQSVGLKVVRPKEKDKDK